MCDIDKKNYISISPGILSIAIIRRYLAECVVVLISYCEQLSLRYSSYSVQWSVHTDFQFYGHFYLYKAFFIKACIMFGVKFLHLVNDL